MRTFTLAVITSITLLVPFSAKGQSYSLDDTVTIVSSRLPLSIHETGRAITVITDSVIQSLPVRSIDEIFTYLPGVETQTRNAFGAQADILIRGSSFNQVLILIDGMRINDPLTGHFNNYIPITPDEIARIELLRGPAAAIYGPDAVGGVILIYTYHYFRKQEKKGFNLRLSGLIGEHELRQGQANLSYDGQKHKISAGTFINDSEGHLLSSGRRAFFDNQTYHAAYSYHDLDKWSFIARGGLDRRDFGAQYFYTTSTFDESTEEVTSYWGQLMAKNQTKNGNEEIGVSYRRTKDSFTFNPAFTINNHKTRFFNSQYIRRFLQHKHVKWNVGVQVDNRSIDSNDRGNHNDWHAGLFSGAHWEPKENVFLSGNLRLDYDENYGLEFLPQISGSHRLGSWVFRIAAGRGIRAGDFTERFIATNLTSVLTSGRNLGNPELEAESVWSTEIGIDFSPSPAWTFSTTVFTRRGNNMIDYIVAPAEIIESVRPLDPQGTYFYAQNLSDLQTAGVEMIGSYTQKWTNHRLRATLSYLHLDTNTQDGEASKYLANHAENLINGYLSLVHKNYSLAISGLWKDRDREVATAINSELRPSYTTWNARATVRLVHNLSVVGQVNNIFDEAYQDILGAEMPGRWGAIGLSWRAK
ncbi:MAG: TonB-dependent receptor [Bacteroidota bacterium]